MDLFERAIFLCIGGVVGFILGYTVARLREIKEELDEVDECVKYCREVHEHIPKRNTSRVRDERGSMRIPLVADAVLLLVVALVAYAAFASHKANNDVEDHQQDVARITECNQEYLANTIEAFNERTTYTQDQAHANVDLQRAQAELLKVLREEPPPSELRSDEAFDKYFEVLSDYLEVNTKTRLKQNEYPYPTSEELDSCLSED